MRLHISLLSVIFSLSIVSILPRSASHLTVLNLNPFPTKLHNTNPHDDHFAGNDSVSQNHKGRNKMDSESTFKRGCGEVAVGDVMLVATSRWDRSLQSEAWFTPSLERVCPRAFHGSTVACGGQRGRRAPSPTPAREWGAGLASIDRNQIMGTRSTHRTGK